MRDILVAWDLANQPCALHAVRENQVYRVGTPARFALRHHREGLRTISQIEAELTWMKSLADAGIKVSAPVPTLSGKLVLNHEDQLYSLVLWLSGRPLGHAQDLLALPNPEATFHTLGQLLARLHALEAPTGLDRPDWTAEALLGYAPLWGQFWNHPDLSVQDRAMVLQFREQAWAELKRLNLPSQLIHADPLQENVLVEGARVALIDFDDCAYGYRAFDVATSLVQRLPDPRFVALRDALLDGYGPIDQQVLALLFVVRCLTYMGWIQDKMDTPRGKAMSGRIVRRAVQQTRAFLGGKSPIG